MTGFSFLQDKGSAGIGETISVCSVFSGGLFLIDLAWNLVGDGYVATEAESLYAL